MNTKFVVLLLSSIPVVCLAQEDAARKNELAFGLGGIPSLSRSDASSLDAGSGIALQVNYGRRFLGGRNAASLRRNQLPGKPNARGLQFHPYGYARLRQSLSHTWDSPEIPPNVENIALHGRRRRLCRLRAEHGTDRRPGQHGSAATRARSLRFWRRG